MKVLINSISQPIQIGLYRDDVCIERIELEGQTSEVLLPIIESLMERYDIERFIYANGPGSHMAIKLTYIALRTIELLSEIPFSSCSAFELNGAKPLKAMGKLYFIKEKETIITQKFEETVKQSFEIPESLDSIIISRENLPDYQLPAV